MKYKIYITLCTLLISLGEIHAQTINSGAFTVFSDTEVTILDDFINTTNGSVINSGDVYFHQNYTNNGLFDFDTNINSGTTHFIGTQVQQLVSASMSLFYNVLFDNPSADPAFNLTGGIYIENEADFLMGVVASSSISNSFLFGVEANHVNTSNASFVDGAVQKQGDTQFAFPVGGEGFYRRLEISSPSDANDVFSSEYIRENSNTQYPHAQSVGIIDVIDTNEYWTLTREQGSSNIVVTLSWDENTTSPEILSGTLSGIHVVRWDETQNFWVDEGGIADQTTETVSTITSVSDYGVFALARVKEDLILPGGIVIYNYLSPDGDGDNDFLRIDGLDQVTDNTVEIFNRHGVRVFQTSDYNDSTNVFRGFSDGRATVNRGEQLPTGTYFYILNYTYNTQRIRKAGYLYINGKE